ncbi:MAG: tRNA uridine-5-carboxymethylaminomethyl(34) synthesis GTPase MnmE [Oscillospiraceae bacterium]|nr:tRNA uridine-5-carboxymethylaminomethyl(34) synthesis GTPase MnmE [Oscillospiraceae bacterium]
MSRVIAAISTAAAPAGLGVIRLSGDDAIEVACRFFRPKSRTKTLRETEGYAALLGRIYDSDGDIDECVALVFRAPHSFTGENVVELSCHGGLYILQRTLRAAIQAGARPAEAGEFTRRAFVNGKMDLTRAEAVMDLISAGGRLAAKSALITHEGALFRRMQKVCGELTGAAANLSAFVDYPDDDIPQLQPRELSRVLENARVELSALLERFDVGKTIREGIDTVIAGRPNVGKSTLMNLLAGCERSIVTPVAGTTRDIIEETIRLGDVVLRLADTAGQRTTTDEVESIGVSRARERMERAALVLAVFDGSRPLDEDDRRLAEAAAQKTSIAIINKSDIEQKIDEEYIKGLYKHTVVLSAKVGEGRDELERAVLEVSGVAALNDTDLLLANERQRDCARRSLDCVDEAISSLSSGMTLDAVGVSIDGAISALLELTGEKTTEAVVN